MNFYFCNISAIIVIHYFNKFANIPRYVNIFQGGVQLLLNSVIVILKKDFQTNIFLPEAVLDISYKSDASFQIFVLNFTDSFSFPYFALTFHVF